MSFLKRLFAGKTSQTYEPESPALADILAKLESVKRQCFVPVIEEGDAATFDSKFSGHPLVLSGHSWPICPNCNRRMQLFWQQDLADANLEHNYPVLEGMLQLFYCVSSKPLCEVDCESYAPFSRASAMRVVPKGAGLTEDLPDGYFPAKTIVGWVRVDDYPNWEEVSNSGIELSDAEHDVYCEEYPLTGEKIGGWPYWVQSVEYPQCPKCGNKMAYLLQVDSQNNLPYMFGDVGSGHLTFCREHPDVMSFHWACH